jgi:hypothetical protein
LKLNALLQAVDNLYESLMWQCSRRVDIKAKDREKRANKAVRDKKIKTWVIIGLIVAVAIGIGFAVATSKTPSAAALTIDGVQCNSAEQLVFHNHAHLDIFVNSQPYTIPSQIGIIPDKCFYWLHTHDTSGTIHIESPITKNYTVGQFLDIWKKTDGNITNGQKDTISAYVNGNKVSAGIDIRNIKLNEHDEIAIAYGKPPSNIPSRYNFSPGT